MVILKVTSVLRRLKEDMSLPFIISLLRDPQEAGPLSHTWPRNIYLIHTHIPLNQIRNGIKKILLIEQQNNI
jgi:hypothetical protein